MHVHRNQKQGEFAFVVCILGFVFDALCIMHMHMHHTLNSHHHMPAGASTMRMHIGCIFKVLRDVTLVLVCVLYAYNARLTLSLV